MPWVTFTTPFYFTPPGKAGRVTILYASGLTSLVTRPCAAAAVAGGKASYVNRPHAHPANGPLAGGRDAIRPAS